MVNRQTSGPRPGPGGEYGTCPGDTVPRQEDAVRTKKDERARGPDPAFGRSLMDGSMSVGRRRVRIRSVGKPEGRDRARRRGSASMPGHG